MNEPTTSAASSLPTDIPHMYILFGNIPLEFHTPDLRNFFSYSIENESFLIFNYRHRPHSTKKCNICICKIKANKFDELVKLYGKKNWLNSRGLIQLSKCSIVKIKLIKNNETSLTKTDDSCLTESELNKLLEFRNIPKWMPEGNVGTPTKTFIGYINQCLMPISLISKLGINLKLYKKHKKRPYASVQYDYSDKVAYFYDHELDVATTANGHKIIEEIDDEKKINELNYLNLQSEQKEEIDDGDDVDEIDNELEDWERHEALNDDVTKQDRTSPYFFENEIELKWEKGGSGLVFYTVIKAFIYYNY